LEYGLERHFVAEAHAARENGASYRWADEALAAEAEEVVDALLR
jgi:hypothetical protein